MSQADEETSRKSPSRGSAQSQELADVPVGDGVKPEAEKNNPPALSWAFDPPETGDVPRVMGGHEAVPGADDGKVKKRRTTWDIRLRELRSTDFPAAERMMLAVAEKYPLARSSIRRLSKTIPDSDQSMSKKRRISSPSQEFGDAPEAKKVKLEAEETTPRERHQASKAPKVANIPLVKGGRAAREAVPGPDYKSCISVPAPRANDVEACKQESARATVVQLTDGMEREISLWCDGSFDQEANCGGYSMVFWDSQAKMCQVMGWENKELSYVHQAELFGIRQCLDMAMRILKSTNSTYPPRQKKVKIFTDSMDSLHMIWLGTKYNLPLTIKAITDIQQYAKAVGSMTGGKVEFHWLKRQGSHEQRLADKCAYKASKMGDCSFLVGENFKSVVTTFGPMLPAVGRKEEVAVERQVENHDL